MIGRLKIISFLVTLMLTLFLALSTTTSAAAMIITVNNSTGPVADYTSIQKSINNANEGDTILVYPGTYMENVDVNVTNIKIKSFSGNPRDTVVLAQNQSDHVFNVSSDLIEISGFTISGARRSGYYCSGIFLYNVSGANISYNILLDNRYGVYLNNSCWNLLIGNNAVENICGIYLVNSSNSNILTYNNATENIFGIYLNGSINNLLKDSRIAENYFYGVSLINSINTTFISNVIWSPSYYNLMIDSDSLDTNKIDSSNLVNGKPIYYFVGASDIKLDSSSNAGIIYLINCKNITVKDQLLEDNKYGIYLYNTTNSSLVNNTALKNYVGIYLSSSSNNILIGNNASNNLCGVSFDDSRGNILTDNVGNSNSYGIFLNNSPGNRLDGNKATGNNFKGIYLNRSSNNTLTANKASLNKYYGIDLRDSGNNYLANNLIENSTYNFNISNGPLYVNYLETNKIESNNLVDGKLIYYFVNVSDARLDSFSNVGTVYLINCNNIQLKDLFLERNGNGLCLYNTTNVILENSTISNNFQGSFLWNSTENSIFSNRISSNKDCGILLTGSSNNAIFNNYFCNQNNVKLEGINTGNIWNITKTTKINIANGDFLGGNFWGTPFENGFSQENLRDIDGDSICDNLYTIDGKNIDFLPLLYVPIQVLTYNSVGEAANDLHIWNCSNCDIFCPRKENNVFAENLRVSAIENRTINKGELIYETEINPVNYRYQENGWKGKNYPVIGFFGDMFVPLRSETDKVGKFHPEKLAKLIFDSKDKHNVRVGECLYLDDGYSIEAKQVDVDGKKVWLEFTKDGEFVDDHVVSTDSVDGTWTCELDNIQSENDVVVLRIHVNQIFKDSWDYIVQIDGIWLIDYENAFTIEPGDEFGVLTVSSIGDNYLEMKNNKPIILERNSINEIAEGLSFKVFDSPELIYYPFKKLTINLEEDPLINDFYPLASEIYTVEGEVQEFTISTGRSSNITLLINGKEVQSKDLTTYFSYQNSNAPEGIYYVQAVASTEDEESRHSWIWIVRKSTEGKDGNEGGGQSSGTGGGGGAGSSPEPAKNVEIKELSQAFVTSDKHVKFDFIRNATCVESIEFDAKRTFGKTTAIIEMLTEKSQLASQLPPGIIYKNINIWVGNEGTSSPENIKNAVIDFKVEKSWLTENNVNTSSIRLYRYSKNLWSVLLTKATGEDKNYFYFRAETPGFSPFVIAGEKEVETASLGVMPETEEVNENSVGSRNLTSVKPQGGVKSPSFESWFAISGLLYGVQMLRMKKN